MFQLKNTGRDKLSCRIEACIPNNIPIRILKSDHWTHFCGSTWNARLGFVGKERDWQAYLLNFDDPKSDTDLHAINMMNVLQTAIEKAFLLTDPHTIVKPSA